jgi:hypothetical protein
VSEIAWIGLAEVTSERDGSPLARGEGAFVHVVGLGDDADALLGILQAELDELDLSLVALEDVEPLLDRQVYGHIGEELLELAATLDSDHRIRLGTFQAFDR